MCLIYVNRQGSVFKFSKIVSKYIALSYNHCSKLLCTEINAKLRNTVVEMAQFKKKEYLKLFIYIL